MAMRFGGALKPAARRASEAVSQTPRTWPGSSQGDVPDTPRAELLDIAGISCKAYNSDFTEPRSYSRLVAVETRLSRLERRLGLDELNGEDDLPVLEQTKVLQGRLVNLEGDVAALLDKCNVYGEIQTQLENDIRAAFQRLETEKEFTTLLRSERVDDIEALRGEIKAGLTGLENQMDADLLRVQMPNVSDASHNESFRVAEGLEKMENEKSSLPNGQIHQNFADRYLLSGKGDETGDDVSSTSTLDGAGLAGLASEGRPASRSARTTQTKSELCRCIAAVRPTGQQPPVAVPEAEARNYELPA